MRCWGWLSRQVWRCSLLFRFSVPFAGYGSVIDNVVPALFAVFFYGVYGGFVIVAILGAAGAYIVHQRRWVASRLFWRRLLLVSAGAAAAPLLLLSVLDIIIGLR